MTIILEPTYQIGDVVQLKIDPETKYVVEYYRIHKVNENG